jgi:NTE family protein
MSRVGVVLGAGGIVGGAFHAGVLTALREVRGIDARDAEVLVGTSAGSVAAAMLRAGLSPDDMLRRAEGKPVSAEGSRLLSRAGVGPPPTSMLRPERPSRLRMSAPEVLARAARRPWQARPGAIAAALLPAGTVPTDMITQGLGAFFPDRWPERALWICAVRLTDGRRVVFGRDEATASVGEAVAASCAIPAYFQPVEIEGTRYVDGGAHSPTNADLVAGRNLDVVVISSPMSASTGPRLALDTGARAFFRAYLQREARRLRREGTKVIVLEPTGADLDVMGINAMDPGRRAAVARQAYESARRRLERD